MLDQGDVHQIASERDVVGQGLGGGHVAGAERGLVALDRAVRLVAGAQALRELPVDAVFERIADRAAEFGLLRAAGLGDLLLRSAVDPARDRVALFVPERVHPGELRVCGRIGFAAAGIVGLPHDHE